MDNRGAVSHRPAARVLCVDASRRVLLLRWHDTVDDVTFWEPPGGGLEAGETPLEAARRELLEETGLPGEGVREPFVTVHRRFRWLGVHYDRHEPFFLARFAAPAPVSPKALTEEERGRLLGHAWLSAGQIAGSREPIEPPDLLQVLARLEAVDRGGTP